MLQFDAATHTYTLAGRKLPSVTEVLAPLQDFSMVPPAVLQAACEFGRNVHIACDLYNRDALDWSSLDAALVPYVRGWAQFLEESGAVVIASECRVYHDELGYAGSPDVVLAWGKRTVLPDLKATAVVPRTVGIQTAAYAKAYARAHATREPERYCIHLQDGKYRSHKRTDPADWSLFLSCLNVWKFNHANS
jgi:hypothetical protein